MTAPVNPIKRLQHTKAFTLIEVMLALAIFSIAGLAFIGTTNSAFTNTILLEEKMYANWVAANRLVDIKLEKKWPLQNNKKGDVKLAEQTWYWQQKIIKTTDDNLKAVVISVSKTEKSTSSTDNISELVTYVSNEN